MTVNTEKITAGPYVGNDIADTFSYGFKITDKTEVLVYETTDGGVMSTLAVDTDYTVDLSGSYNGGTITRVAGPLPTGYQWYIRSNFDATQLTTFTSQGAFFPELHEAAMDKLTYLIQQTVDQMDRSITAPDSYSGTLPLTMQDPDAGKVLRWNEEGDGVENFDTDEAYVNVSGDTMTSPLSGPYAESNEDYVPRLQVLDLVDDRIASTPGFDPGQYIDYGLVTSSVGDAYDYGSVA